MKSQLALVFATAEESEPIIRYLQHHAEQKSFQTYSLHGLSIDILYSGIGLFHTTFSLMEYLSHRRPEGWIQFGIGGALDVNLSIPETYAVASERLYGFGAQESNGDVSGPFELNWWQPDASPFTDGLLHCEFVRNTPFVQTSAYTTMIAHGAEWSIEKLKSDPPGQIENMEGFSFFYISLLKKIPFQSIRSISNRVTLRDKSQWQMKEAIVKGCNDIITWLESAEFKMDKLFYTSGMD